LIELGRQDRDQRRKTLGANAMLAEKFFLLLETLKSNTYRDGSPRVKSTSPHVPVKLPNRT
jgi:hypothetical protein